MLLALAPLQPMKSAIPRANLNALNGLFLWGLLTPTQLSWLTGVSLSLCCRQLHNLVKNGLAEDLGRSHLSPSDPLYGRYFLLRKSSRLKKFFTSSPCQFGRVRGNIGAEKILSFKGGFQIPRHYVFSVHCTSWVVSFLGGKIPGKAISAFPESYLRRRLGWHHLMGPARSVSNPKFTMVPDSLVVFDGQEIKIEAEITPKSKGAYAELFQAARPLDDNIIYIFPDSSTKQKVLPNLPSGYRVSSCVFGNEGELGDGLFKLFPSLFAR